MFLTSEFINNASNICIIKCQGVKDVIVISIDKLSTEIIFECLFKYLTYNKISLIIQHSVYYNHKAEIPP